MTGLHVLRGVLLRPRVIGFSARAADDLGGDDDRARDLVIRQLPGAVRAEVLDRRGDRAGSERHDRRHLLSPARARRADDERVPHRGMALHDALHLLGEDLRAARVDARRVAAEEDQAAVLGEAGAVAADAITDAVDDGERLARTLGVAEVPERQVTLRRDPPDLVAARLEEA